MGQRGQLDRISLAHAGPILALDWSLPSIFSSNANSRNGNSAPSSQGSNWYAGVGSGLFDDLGSNTNTSGDGDGTGMGWLASGGMDRCVKVDSSPVATPEMTSKFILYAGRRYGTSLLPAEKLVYHDNLSTRCIPRFQFVACCGVRTTTANWPWSLTWTLAPVLSPPILLNLLRVRLPLVHDWDTLRLWNLWRVRKTRSYK